jgi:Protein of unknown function (DUF4038)/Putative collagen-binding domain of a collagenase
MKGFIRVFRGLGCIALLALAGVVPLRAATLPQLRISSNGRYFVQEGGRPFLYLGDTAWTILDWTRQDADTYLHDRAKKGFTVIQISIAGFDTLTVPDAYGHTIFVNRDPSRPNEAYFQDLDYVVNEAESLGLYVALVPLWANNYERPRHVEGFPDDPHANVLTRATAYSYGDFLGARYRNKPVIWILGGDWFATGYEDIWRSMAAGIERGEDGVHHLMTYHEKSPRSSSQWFQHDAWLSFNMIQSGHTVFNRNYDLVAEDWSKLPVKPVVDGEGGYEGIKDAMAPGHTIDAADVRRIAYSALFAGAAGYTYGAHGVWGYRSPSGGHSVTARAFHDTRHGVAPPWAEALQLPAGSQMRYLRSLLESRPMLERIPDQWLIANDPMGTVNRIEATRAQDGSYAFIYTAAGGTLRIRMIDGIYNKLSGKTIRAYWYNPRDGSSTLIGDFAISPFRDFTAPSSGHGNDWVLVLDDLSKNYPAPGTAFKHQR